MTKDARPPHENAAMEVIGAIISEGLVMLDGEGRVTSMNPAAERMLGGTSAGVLGRGLDDVIRGRLEDGPPLPAEDLPLLRAMRTREPHEGEAHFTHEDRSPIR